MTSGAFRRVGERQVHQGYVWRVVVADFVAPDGEAFTRDIVRSPGAVGVVPIVSDPDGTPSVVLVRQYRPAHELDILEIPAGMRDVPGEPPEVTGHRELVEEAGLDADTLVHLIDFYPSPGLTDSVCTVFLATGCRSVPPRAHGPEEAHMEVVRLALADAVAMVAGGEIRDAKTVIGLLLAERRLATSAGPGVA